jgi:hypothetical protein
LATVVTVALLVVATGTEVVGLVGCEVWCAGAELAGVLVEFVSVKTSTSSSKGLDHITRWALRKE